MCRCCSKPHQLNYNYHRGCNVDWPTHPIDTSDYGHHCHLHDWNSFHCFGGSALYFWPLCCIGRRKDQFLTQVQIPLMPVSCFPICLQSSVLCHSQSTCLGVNLGSGHLAKYPYHLSWAHSCIWNQMPCRIFCFHPQDHHWTSGILIWTLFWIYSFCCLITWRSHHLRRCSCYLCPRSHCHWPYLMPQYPLSLLTFLSCPIWIQVRPYYCMPILFRQYRWGPASFFRGQPS